jgi:hypothetical protein
MAAQMNRQMLLRAINDAGKMAKGFFSILSDAFSTDVMNLGFSYFSTPSQYAKKGNLSEYRLEICSHAIRGVWVDFLFGIYSKEKPDRFNDHCSYFKKTIFIKARNCQRVTIAFNWKDHARLTIAGTTVRPDVVRTEKSISKGKYYVRAMLLDEKRAAFDSLTLVQTLSG